MKRTLLLSAACLAATLFTACTQDDAGLLPEASEGIPMTFTATGLNPTAATTTGTRATVDGDWKGVTAVAIQIGNEVKAYRVTPSSDNLTATLSSDDPHYWAGESAVTVSAWWPYTDGQTSMPAVTVQADQRGDGYAQSDHIGVAEELLHYNGGTPTLAFTHRTARIVVTVSGGTSSISSVRLTNLSTADGNPGEIIAHDAGSGIYEALVTPQSVTQGTAFVTIATTDGKTYVYRMKQDADWEAGAEHKYGLFFGLFVTCPASTTTGTRSVLLHKASVFQHNHFVFKSRKVDAFGRKRR
ncbi:MAG: fimbrillin family protein [Candidatus Bacteroides intestinipullorum]|uniref:Fimbrillin family protein n=1 Tax=Candidatus Bacteroides intestinipullorum TaxID=2838471 RepID=A0A9E2NPS0_9BACE|nr:fimbrillin family protein [Candidatus Bacteroides intestinipullorum]